MNLLSKISWYITLSVGWRRHLICFSTGSIGALAMAPFNFFPAICVPLSTAIWLIDGSIQSTSVGGSKSPPLFSMEAAIDGWWMGFGYFLAGLWWLGAAFFIEAEKFGVLAPFAVLGLSAVLALFFSAGFCISRLIWSQNSWRCLSLAIGLGLSEWLRAQVFTGFPWNNLGMALAANVYLAQSASVIGLHGMAFVAIFLSSAPACLADPKFPKRRRAIKAAIAILVCLFAVGAVRLSRASLSFEPEIQIRVIQPNIAQGAKFIPAAMDEIIKKHLELSIGATEGAKKDIDLVSHFVWPESPFPVPLSLSPSALAQIASIIPSSSTVLTGAIRPEFGSNGNRVFFNSIHAISSKGEIVGNYDKRHLVPFGEYLPFESLLTAAGLRQFVHVPGGFSSGSQSNVLRVTGLPPIAAMICYEAIFPRTSPNSTISERPALILNVTNDAWFGITPGPHQHFSQARLRAIEEGLPLVRAANSGISAIVDPYGRVLKSLPLGVEGVLDGRLPRPIATTLFSRYPTIAPMLVVLLMLLALFLSKRSTVD